MHSSSNWNTFFFVHMCNSYHFIRWTDFYRKFHRNNISHILYDNVQFNSMLNSKMFIKIEYNFNILMDEMNEIHIAFFARFYICISLYTTKFRITYVQMQFIWCVVYFRNSFISCIDNGSTLVNMNSRFYLHFLQLHVLLYFMINLGAAAWNTQPLWNSSLHFCSKWRMKSTTRTQNCEWNNFVHQNPTHISLRYPESLTTEQSILSSFWKRSLHSNSSMCFLSMLIKILERGHLFMLTYWSFTWLIRSPKE